jgi:CspA family cold shock protein
MRPRLFCGATHAWEDIMPTGTVKWFNHSKGYGFLESSDSSGDVFVHISAVEQAGLSGLQEGQKVTFELESGRNGKTSAVNLKVE